MIILSPSVDVSGVLDSIRTTFETANGSTVEAGYQTLINVTGRGILYGLFFQKRISGTANLKLTLDGTAYEFISAGINSTFAIIHEPTENIPAPFTKILTTDASYYGVMLNIEFDTSLKVEYNSNDGAEARAKVNYGTS